MNTTDQLAQQMSAQAAQSLDKVVTPGLTAWVSAHTWEIIIACFALLAGYAVGQWLKSFKNYDPSASMLAFINGTVSFVCMAWWLPEAYSLHEKIKIGSMIGVCSPFLVMGLFMVIDKFFPGKGDAIKNGIYFDEDDEDDPVRTKIARFAAASVMGKRSDKRENRTSTRVWTQAEREAARRRSEK